jgi:hypothetical protein
MVPELPTQTSVGWTVSWAAFFVTLGVLIRQLVPWRKTRLDADQRLREDLLARVQRLEHQLERQQVRHEAERQLDRTSLNNVTQCFDAMLLLIEMAPEKASETAVRIRDMRAAQMKAEAELRAVITQAEMEDDKEPTL